ncbi:MAG: DeoR family transcriptional regulator [Rariglobus sp.]|jgi:dienelactone hydrolase|nr:DeoR family transcriptional regulator [Rariglobus sp.]
MKHTVTSPALWWQGDVHISAGHSILEGTLAVPENAGGLVIFAHGSGSSRHSERNRSVAATLQREGLATLLFDLLTLEEEHLDARMEHLRFDIDFLSGRLRAASAWAARQEQTMGLRIGYFGASTGAAAALVAASENENASAVVSRGGRPDLAGDALQRVDVPTLLIVGSDDEQVLSLNEHALAQLRGTKRLEIVPGATHLFEEPGALDAVAALAAGWFGTYLPATGWSP